MDLQAALAAEPITTAGKAEESPPADPRKEAIRLIRTTLRKQDATDDEVDGAIEALLELAKD
jgi:hypothetical protein